MPIPTVRVLPKTGARVRDPETMILVPAEGIVAPMNSHWLRQQKDGAVDLEVIRPEPAPEPKTKTKTEREQTPNARPVSKSATPAKADTPKGN